MANSELVPFHLQNPGLTAMDSDPRTTLPRDGIVFLDHLSLGGEHDKGIKVRKMVNNMYKYLYTLDILYIYLSKNEWINGKSHEKSFQSSDVQY